MDAFFLIALAFGLVYAMVRGARWAFKIDREEWRKRERLPRRERRRDTGIFDSIVQHLKKDQ